MTNAYVTHTHNPTGAVSEPLSSRAVLAEVAAERRRAEAEAQELREQLATAKGQIEKLRVQVGAASSGAWEVSACARPTRLAFVNQEGEGELQPMVPLPPLTGSFDRRTGD